MVLGVSTTWNFDRVGTLAGAVREIRDLGFAAVELRAKAAVPDLVEGARRCRELRLSCRSVHAPLTSGPWSEGDPTRHLAATDETWRRRAVAAVLGTLPAAAAAGAEVVVLHLGEVPIEGAAERQARWLSAVAAGEAPPAKEIRAALAERRRRRDVHLEAAALSLFDLARAEPGVTWSIETRKGYHEIPDFEEVELLIEDAAGRRVAYTHDTGHAHFLSRLGITESLRWLDRYGARTSGLHLHDVAGDVDHLPPGSGEIDWGALRTFLSPSMIHTLEIHGRHSAAELRLGADHLESR